MFRSISRGTLSAILACVLAASLILMPLQFAFAAYSYGETEKDSLPVNGDVSGESDAGIVADDEAENSSVAEDMVSDFDGDVVRGAEMLSGENGITATLADSPLVAQADNDISNAHCFLIDPFRGAVNAINLRLILDGRALSLNKDYEITGCVDDKGNPVTQISEAGFYTFSYRGIGSYTGTGSIRLENYDMAPIGNFNDAYIADCNLVYTGSHSPSSSRSRLGASAWSKALITRSTISRKTVPRFPLMRLLKSALMKRCSRALKVVDIRALRLFPSVSTTRMISLLRG